MATPEEEQRRRDDLDARRKAGDNAWSPSRAREAVRRKFNQPKYARPDKAIQAAEDVGAFESPDDFERYRVFVRVDL